MEGYVYIYDLCIDQPCITPSRMISGNTRHWYVVKHIMSTDRQELAGNCHRVFRDEDKTLILLVILSNEW